MLKGLTIALGLAAFVAVQSASADCRSEFKDCITRDDSGSRDRDICSKT